MNFGRSCKFYENSRCILHGKYCDLICDRFRGEEDFRFYDRIDALTRWRMETGEKVVERSGWKAR